MKYRGESSDGIDLNHPWRSPNIEGIFSTSFTMAYPTIQFIIMIKKSKWQTPKKKDEKPQQFTSSNLKFLTILEVLIINQMKRNTNNLFLFLQEINNLYH